MVRHCTRASHGPVNVKPREQIIESEIKLVRLKLNSNSQFLINSQSNIPAELKLCQREGIVVIQVCGERVLSQNRMKRKRLSDQKKTKQKVKFIKRVEKTRKKVREDTKICRIR